MTKNKRWTTQRQKDVDNLSCLLQNISQINNGSNFIKSLEACIKLANELQKQDIARLDFSFITFLRNLINEEAKNG